MNTGMKNLFKLCGWVFSFYAVMMGIETVHLEAATAMNRGMWFWQNDTHPWGSTQVVGNEAKENEVITDLKNAGVKRLYGGYGTRPQSEPAVIAAWNTKLHAAGIQSQVVFSDSNYILPDQRVNLLNKIQARFLDFNSGRSVAAERFDGVHLDLEPQALTEWSTLTALDKKQYLFYLRDTYTAVREHLNTSGAAGTIVAADLAFWFDKNPGQIDWASDAERDQWFADIQTSLSNISLMAYEQKTLSSLLSSTSYELGVFPQGDVALNVKDIGAYWIDLHEMMDMLLQIESPIVSPTAIHSYSYYKDALATTSNISPVLSPIGDQTVNEGQNLVIQITATDANNDPLNYSVPGFPAGASFDPSQRTFSWTPNYQQTGTYSITFSVTDGIDTTSQIATVIVKDVPLPDLKLTGLSGPISGSRGSKVTITSTVKNQGNAVCSSFTVALYLSSDTIITSSDIKIGSYSVSNLNAGASLQKKSSITLATSLVKGAYYLGAIADINNQRLEADETNNSLTGNTFTVK